MGSGRDLLYKPTPTPTTLPDDATGARKVDKAGVKTPRGRDIGEVPGEKPVRAPPPTTTPTGKAPAHKSAYFNRDISGVREVNQRQSNMQALRGAQGATDLKKVVLPPAVGVENPDPVHIQSVGQLMGLAGNVDLSLEALLGRQSGWARGQGVTVEMLVARLRQLDAMVEARKVALQRMLENRRGRVGHSVTVDRAAKTEGSDLTGVEDVAAEGKTLIERTAKQAVGMHRRLAKMLGIKRST